MIVQRWLLPVLIAVAVMIALQATLFANPEPTVDELTNYLQTNQLEVGTETVDGRQQIYYAYDDIKIFVTDNDRNHIHPVANKRFMAWEEISDGQSQIVVYDVLTQASQQVTSFTNNQNPAIASDGRVVWERWVDEKWQIFYYGGGSAIQQLSFDDSSVRPTIQGDKVAFAQVSSVDRLWRVIQYDLTTRQTTEVNSSNGEQAWPRFQPDGTLSTTP